MLHAILLVFAFFLHLFFWVFVFLQLLDDVLKLFIKATLDELVDPEAAPAVRTLLLLLSDPLDEALVTAELAAGRTHDCVAGHTVANEAAEDLLQLGVVFQLVAATALGGLAHPQRVLLPRVGGRTAQVPEVAEVEHGLLGSLRRARHQVTALAWVPVVFQQRRHRQVARVVLVQDRVEVSSIIRAWVLVVRCRNVRDEILRLQIFNHDFVRVIWQIAWARPPNNIVYIIVDLVGCTRVNLLLVIFTVQYPKIVLLLILIRVVLRDIQNIQNSQVKPRDNGCSWLLGWILGLLLRIAISIRINTFFLSIVRCLLLREHILALLRILSRRVECTSDPVQLLDDWSLGI